MDVDEHDGDAAGESQASQILKNAMERGSDEEEDFSTRIIPVDEPDISKDLSSGSFNPRSAPQYHYHGLATTQTQSQSQYDDESSPNEGGSQKENLNSSRAALSSSGDQIQRGDAQSPRHPSKVTLVQTPTCVTSKSTANARTVSFESPKAVATPSKPPEARSTGRPPRRVAPPPKRELSVDSFAGEFEDPAEKFIASSKKFDIPLAQLGVVSPSVERSPLASRRTMYTDDVPSVEDSAQRATGTNEEEGTILVNATPTPSNSGSSQSQSQLRQSQPHSPSQSQEPMYGESDDYSLYARQPEEDDRIMPPQPAGSPESTQYESSEPTSSYRRLYEPLTPALEPTQILEPTQLIDEPTQMIEATQLVEDHSVSLHSSNARGADTFSNAPSTAGQARTLLDSLPEHKRKRYAEHLDGSESLSNSDVQGRGDTFSNATSAAGQPRSLLSSLPESKRKRYADNFGQISRVDHVDASVTDYSTSGARGGYSALQDTDTQPAFEHEHAPLNRSIAQPKPSTSAAPRLRQALVDERTEVIPDSEPPREGSLSPVSPPKPSTRSPPKSRARPASSDTETDTEVIPDSMDVDGEDKDEKNMSRPEEEKEEEEEEVPLSRTRKGGKQANVKGKGKAVEMRLPPIKLKDTLRKPKALNPPKKRRTREVFPEVPSSVPRQDSPAANEGTAAKLKAGPKAKSAAATRVRKRVGGSSKRGNARNETEEEESSEDELLMLRSERDEEVSTEPADDDDEYMAAGPSTRKRKRGIKTKSISVQPQPRARRATKSSPPTRPAKRARAISTSTYTASEPTRVFALWRKDGNYYSGLVHSQIEQGRYRVDFDDNTSDDVRLDQMRLCNPKVGDNAFVAGLPRIVVITKVLLADEKVHVEADNFEQDVHVSHLRIGSRMIASGWADRVLTVGAIVCAVKPPKSLTSPTPSRLSVHSAGSSRRSDLFSKIGFCITHAVEAEEEKEVVAARIKSNGGVVIEDWEDVITIKGKQVGNRWTLDESDVNPVFRGLERVFLLSDDACQTSKFLLALALGIPCVRIDFIARAIETGDLTDWMMNLLPAGFSESHNCRVTQFVNADWGDDPDDIKKIMGNPVTHKVFSGKTILYIGPEVLTATKGRKKNVGLAIPRIMLAMGAESVEAVREAKHASCALSAYDYIVNKSNARIAKKPDWTVVPWDWVKDALISGCIPAIPETQ
ncbi:hypothetical protein B0H17DRAFT_1029359 [Mycena rosella]|uniref:BRCT domain-containing protein n=1 Tax=Mycena rosella TaxID=1033263 RepID=A0AAD7MBT4_MYCRO|nr:hypothetical protein B0H17DRAFT_1029359 [Mycena rosella]